MPILSNPKHERFAQELAQGKSASEAYELAGYAPNDGNSIRLKGNERVSARVRELQGKVAADAEVTVQSLLREAAEIQQAAKEAGQMSAAVAALTAKAKIAGKWIDRKEIGDVGEFGAIDGMNVDELRAYLASQASPSPDDQDETRH